MSDIFIPAICMMAMFITGMLVAHDSDALKLAREAQIQIDMCEEKLSRNNFCKLTAIPEGKIDE